MVKAYRYGGRIYLKRGSRKSSPGVMYSREDLQSGRRPEVELWRDGTITYCDRPEGTIAQMAFIAMPAWAYDYQIKSFKSRS